MIIKRAVKRLPLHSVEGVLIKTSNIMLCDQLKRGTKDEEVDKLPVAAQRVEKRCMEIQTWGAPVFM